MKGPISYMASNHVASNILMLLLVIGGLVMVTDPIFQAMGATKG